ncbi:MAG: FkbM family methyltransferase [Elusimicrobia bacterium]|nr:FkbM family methyltransferase [Elusimicrobiota bacterium]
MAAIKDRRGRGLTLTIYGADGAVKQLDAAALEAVLRVKRVLSGKPELCTKAIEKILALTPTRLEIRFWNEKKILLNVPADLGNFINDVDCVIIRDQYNAGDLAGKIVVDAGANIGLFSLYASTLGARKVYPFEAVAETCKILNRNLALNGALKAVNIALGAEKGEAEIKFNTRGEGSSMIDCGDAGVNREITYSGRRLLKVAPLDGLVKGRVDFIKLDVEGYEKNVLLGAARIIRKYKPVLSLAAYHRPVDKKVLPKVIRSLRADYKITLNTFAEHDLYCE